MSDLLMKALQMPQICKSVQMNKYK